MLVKNIHLFTSVLSFQSYWTCLSNKKLPWWSSYSRRRNNNHFMCDYVCLTFITQVELGQVASVVGLLVHGAVVPLLIRAQIHGLVLHLLLTGQRNTQNHPLWELFIQKRHHNLSLSTPRLLFLNLNITQRFLNQINTVIVEVRYVGIKAFAVNVFLTSEPSVVTEKSTLFI